MINKNNLLLILASVFTIIGATWLNGCPGMQAQGQYAKDKCPMMMKDVSVNTTEIDQGVRIEITSDNPDTVKMIQEHAAMHSKMQEKMHSHMKSEEKESCKHNCPCKVEGATISITNTDKGVIMEITSDKDEAIKEIKSRAEKMKEMHKPEVK